MYCSTISHIIFQFQNGMPVPLDTDRFQVEITPDEVIITDKKVQKDDAGPYEVKLENEKGQATAPVQLKVLGPPASPKGPLEINDVKAESCKLSWNPPTVSLKEAQQECIRID